MKRIWQDIVALRNVSKYFAAEWLRLRKLLIQTMILIVLCEIMMIIQILPLQGITNILVETIAKDQPFDYYSFANLSLFLIISLLVGVFLHTWMDNKRNDFIQGEFAVMHSASMDKLLSLPTSWHVEHSTGEKDSKIKENVDRLEYVVSSLSYGAFPVFVRIFITSLALFFVDWMLLLFGILAQLGYLFLTRINLKVMKALSHEWHTQRESISEHSKTLTANWYALRSFGREDEYIEKHSRTYMGYWDDDRQRHVPWRNRLSTHEIFVATSTVMFYWLVALITQVQAGVTVGTLVMAMFWMTRLLSNLYQLNDFLRYIYRGMESLHELVEFFKSPSDMPQPENPEWPDHLNGWISFKNVFFKYPGKSDYALNGIDLEIKAGEVVALVGESGGGKSTIFSLIAGERPATEGEVSVDGIDIRKLDLKRYRRESIALVPQRSSLLADTIAENVALGKCNATEEDIKEALRKAHVLEDIESLPGGIYSKVGEQGVFLSGGQQQRVAIARAVIRETSSLLLLDEATSSLDGPSQHLVQQTFQQMITESNNKTVVVIAHRLSTVKIASKIIVVRKGKIIGQGTHDELMTECSYYRKLCELELGNGNGGFHHAATI